MTPVCQGHSSTPHKSLSLMEWSVLEGDDSSKVLQNRVLSREPPKNELYAAAGMMLARGMEEELHGQWVE